MRKGFTLAEVLVTLAVIGIVAALAIPALLQNTNDAQYKTAWKKGFSDLNQAAKVISIAGGNTLKGVFPDDLEMRNKFLDQLNYVKSCNNSSEDECWHAANTWFNPDGTSRAANAVPGAILNNGTLVSFNQIDETCNTSFGGGNTRCGVIEIDINGFKKPNIIGKDIFALSVTSNTLLPYGSNGDWYNETCYTTGWGCSTEYLYK